MKAWTRWLGGVALVLAAVLMLSAAVPAFAAEAAGGSCGNYLTWSLSEDGTLTISGSGDMWDYSNTRFAPWASAQYSKVVVEDGVTGIGAYAFYWCPGLTEISMPNTVTRIGDYAFYWCAGLTEISLPDKLTSIGEYAFAYCSGLKKLTLPDSVTSLGAFALQGCAGLTGVTLSRGITCIEEYTFYGCTGLTVIVIPSGVTRIEEHAFSCCTGLSSLTVPSPVNRIGAFAFSYCSGLTKITLPGTVTDIEKYAFQGCSSLTNISIPKGVTDIGDGAFSGCSRLTGIWVDKNNTCYTNDSEGVLFSKDKTRLISVPATFAGHFYVSEGVTEITANAFSGCRGVTGVILPDGVQSIGVSAFENCTGMTAINLPDSITHIAEYAFYNCGALRKIVLPPNVTAIADGTFSWCSSLVSVTVPRGVTAVGAGAFDSAGIRYAFFRGTKQEKEALAIASGNEALTGAMWHYGVTDTILDGQDCYYCTECRKYFLPAGASIHNYEIAVTEPGCVTAGYTTYTCSGCGDSYVTHEVDALGHSFQNGLCACGEISFPDVSSSAWYYNSVKFAVQKGYFTGYKSGNFGPDDKITRQDFVVVLARVAGVDLSQYSGRTGFPDVKAGDYYEKAVKWASSNGIVNGYKNGNFGVGDSITREQLVTILYNFARKNGYDVSVPDSAAAKLSGYTDAHKITGYARNAVIWALHKGVISGMTATTIAPQNTASRAQTATILMNISKKGIMEI